MELGAVLSGRACWPRAVSLPGLALFPRNRAAPEPACNRGRFDAAAEAFPGCACATSGVWEITPPEPHRMILLD